MHDKFKLKQFADFYERIGLADEDLKDTFQLIRKLTEYSLFLEENVKQADAAIKLNAEFYANAIEAIRST